MEHCSIQPILCYCKGSATPSSVWKIGTWSTICRNYPTVGIAPPYLTTGVDSACPASLLFSSLSPTFDKGVTTIYVYFTSRWAMEHALYLYFMCRSWSLLVLLYFLASVSLSHANHRVQLSYTNNCRASNGLKSVGPKLILVHVKLLPWPLRLYVIANSPRPR